MSTFYLYYIFNISKRNRHSLTQLVPSPMLFSRGHYLSRSIKFYNIRELGDPVFSFKTKPLITMAIISSSSSSPKGIVVSVHVLVLSVTATAVLLFFLFSSFYSSSTTTPPRFCSCPEPVRGEGERISSRVEDVEWVKEQIKVNGIHMQDNVLRKGINPRTREQQLQDLIQ